MSIDLLLVNPGNAEGIYQSLANEFAAIEPPTWSLLLAESVRSKGFTVEILDVNAERLNISEAANIIISKKYKLICFVVYGQNVNAGTVSMSGATQLSLELKNIGCNSPISFIGSYIQALPKKAMKDEDSIDFAFTNEGVYALWNILKLDEIDSKSLSKINGIIYRDNGQIIMNPPEKIVPNERMDQDLPGYAWDLLPFRNKPLDLYRSPLWHAGYQEKLRSPYAAIQTSLGCNFGCSFCMINIINRSDNDEIGIASNYKGMRFWSTDFNLKQFDILNNLGVSTIRIVDEMFLLYKKHYLPLCEGLASKKYAPELRLWSYSRVDTVTNPEFLKIVRSAGIRWLSLGIESADKNVRLEVSKGKFEDVDIYKVIGQVHKSDIDVMANYIVGLPGDTRELMEKTLNLSVELMTAGWNMYAAMALPGSELYSKALSEGVALPEKYTGYSFHSVDTLPLPTKTLSPAEILKFRDEAFIGYHSNPIFLKLIKAKFGSEAEENIKNILKIKLTRNILK